MRLIDADRLISYAIAFFTGDYANISEFAHVSHIINIAPTVDAVPVIRCRDCIFYDPENSSNWCSHPKGLCNPGESDFCSYSQRKNQSADVRNMEEGNEHE